ncbi:MAG: hypothetical protein Kow0099_19310 [Candidatus Abyssubacteria bacterium]
MLALNGEDFRPLEVRLSAATHEASVFHALTEQLAALDQLEKSVLNEVPHAASGSAAQEMLKVAHFFCDTRSLISHRSHPRTGNERFQLIHDESDAFLRLRSVRFFDDIIQEILNPSVEPDKVLEMICKSVLKIAPADAVAIFTIYRKTGDFVLKQFMIGPALRELEENRLPEVLHNFKLIPRGSEGATGLFDVALREKKPVFVSNISDDPRVHKAAVLADFGITGLLLVPMFASGKELGFMAVVLATARSLPDTERENLAVFADLAAVAWRNAELYSELRQSEQRYKDLIENAIDMIFILDMEGRFVSINRRTEEVTGYSAQEWLGRSFFEILPPESLPDAMDLWTRGLSGGKEVASIKIVSASGDDLYLDLNSSLILEDDKVVGMMCIARDSTEKRKREEEFKKLHDSVVEANRKLEESMAELQATQLKLVQTEKLSAMGELISGIGHELNNPLTGIIGYSQLLLETVSAPEYRRNIEKINQEALRCKKIVHSLLGFARAHKPQKRVLDLNAVIQSVINLREYQLNADGIRFVTRLDDQPLHVVGDFHQLQQLLLNLVNNAHQAITNAKQGTTVEIRTARDPAARIATFSVTDDGPGIPPNVLPRIFDPFFTTREVGQGTGLGLSVAYGIARDHGGHISAESSPGKGAAFLVELPLAKSECSTVKAKPAPERPTATEKIHVLLVDDEEVILDLLTDILAQMNVTSERAHNGHEALEKLKASSFDGIICDLKMPGMDGKTLYRKIEETYPELCRKMIFSTGDTLSSEFRAFCAATGCNVVEKPFLIEDIKSAIEALGKI